MSSANRFLVSFGAMLVMLAPVLLYGADDALPPELEPALRADLSPDGLLTGWLYGRASEAGPNGNPPVNAREGAPVFGANGAVWALSFPDTFYNEIPVRSNPADAKAGPLFVAARFHSTAGGKRFFYIRTNSSIKLFLDGKLVASKPQPPERAVFKFPIDLPVGVSELVLELAPHGDSCIIQCLLHDGRGDKAPQKPVAGDSIVLPTIKEKPCDAAAAAFRCFTVMPKTPFVAPGGKVAIGAWMQGSQPRVAGAITARLVGKDNHLAEENAPVAIGSIFQTEFTAPAELSISYEARLEFFSNGKSLGIKTVPLICLEGFGKEAEALERDWQARSAKSKQPMPNAKLAIEKIKLFVEGIAGGLVDADPETAKEMLALVGTARSFMEVEELGKDPLAGKSGYMERAYVSRIDNGVQPYLVSVPEKAVAENAEKFPLIVFLHGYDPNMNKHRWWEARDYAAVCARNNCFLAIPFGRLNTDFQGCGEVDVFDVINEMKAHYRIDPDRIYLCGISMGGMGVYTIVAHYPDMFAAGMVMAGRADSPLQNYTALENFHPFKQWLIHADNPVSLCENLINTPLRIYHGQDDNVVPTTQALRMNAALKKAGCDPKLLLVPGGHRAGFDILREDEPVQWLLSQKRNSAPASRHLKTYSLQYVGGAFVKTSNALEPIDVEWKGGGKDQIQIIKMSGNVLDFGFPNLTAVGGLHKTQEMCGPVRQAICAPFTIVYGTKGTPEANVLNKQNAERFAQEWFAFTRSQAKIESDTEVTADEKRERNLFLFGEEQDNALHAELAKDLPIAVKNGSVTIGGKTETLQGRGIIYIFPSAFSGNKRVVVICAGIPYGEKVGVNHKLDLVPDFLFYNGTAFDTDGTSTNTALCAGFFDNDWKIEPARMWWFEKK